MNKHKWDTESRRRHSIYSSISLSDTNFSLYQVLLSKQYSNYCYLCAVLCSPVLHNVLVFYRIELFIRFFIALFHSIIQNARIIIFSLCTWYIFGVGARTQTKRENESVAYTHNPVRCYFNILVAFRHLKLVVAYFLHYLMWDPHLQNYRRQCKNDAQYVRLGAFIYTEKERERDINT